MCSSILGEHNISFIFVMSLQQIFILDILRLRAAIFYKSPLSVFVLALFLSPLLSLPLPSFLPSKSLQVKGF